MRSLLKFFIIIGVFSVGMQSQAQLFVSSGSFLYVNDLYITVTQDVNLASAGHIYLRNESQLLQKTTLGSNNIGLGTLSAFQEGTSNNFGYNYWCSPVGEPTASVGNSNFGISLLKRPTGLTTFGGEAIITTLNGSTTNAALNISSRWIYTLTTTNQYSNWSYIAAATSIGAGQGFTMKGVSGSDNTTVLGVQNNPGNSQRYDFRGKPNDGNINIPVGNSFDGATSYTESTLTGNPYPSAINLNLFLLENNGRTVDYVTGAVSPSVSPIINGNAYFWEHQKPATSHTLSEYVGGYGVYVPNNVNAFSPGTYTSAPWNTYNGDGSFNNTSGNSGVNYRRMFSPVGQGFIIKGSVAAGTAIMRNRYRAFMKEGVANNSQFERNANNYETNSDSDTNWPEIPNLTGTDYTQFSKLQVPQIRIQTILNNQFTREVVLAFNPNATDGLDNAYDAPMQGLNLPTDVYFPLTADNQFAISTLPFDINKRIPFALKAVNQSTFRVYVGEIINFEEAENIFLFDSETNIYHDIKNSFVDITLPAGGTTNERFEVTFLDETLGNETIKSEQFMIVQNNDSGLLSIKNPNLVDLKSATLFDITGKLIFTKEKLGAQEVYSFPTIGLSDSIYIVKLITADNQEISKKVSIYRVN
ncbi:T9SS sorting signal type C domain-containing protein [Flavobacterium lacus]|uniref:Putative secreted protein (Por secretion system target) n=1 Tax=Flavobacterium lacus TaxID=1353778 RepID=A0A328WQK6_9FLAO|nr:T9SS sorting signal type C domain-containing protein [Flavobacterium lacus]RAR47545.1 putative secreted protein (Por secretion system target) [Flavobacterium lacus]